MITDQSKKRKREVEERDIEQQQDELKKSKFLLEDSLEIDKLEPAEQTPIKKAMKEFRKFEAIPAEKCSLEDTLNGLQYLVSVIKICAQKDILQDTCQELWRSIVLCPAYFEQQMREHKTDKLPIFIAFLRLAKEVSYFKQGICEAAAEDLYWIVGSNISNMSFSEKHIKDFMEYIDHIYDGYFLALKLEATGYNVMCFELMEKVENFLKKIPEDQKENKDNMIRETIKKFESKMKANGVDAASNMLTCVQDLLWLIPKERMMEGEKHKIDIELDDKSQNVGASIVSQWILHTATDELNALNIATDVSNGFPSTKERQIFQGGIKGKTKNS